MLRLGRGRDGTEFDKSQSEIAALQEQLLTSEATIHSLQAAVHQRDKLIRQLQPRAELLQDICRQRPPLVGLLAALAEAERLGPLPASDPGAPSLLLANNTEEEGDRDHLQPAVFGTTV
ncbi:Vimentin-type intermediate filament-associated coiled-coil protein [Myotis davidii]|uniref:Vimentin-type intermediate filament-associated coiled-coil protein n=1 Tax=Myotis davidii TaxID=225400 RepID=L5LUX9_MYODS|nr:Vimentin-type intermediate filament-associated coiled-coil protein [Myotis davidii]